MMISAIIRGRTKKSTAEKPKVRSASISWLVFMLPICAANADVVASSERVTATERFFR